MNMHAIVISTQDGPLDWRSVPRPVAGDNEVLVRIVAAGLNPLDAKIRAGKAAHARHPFPCVPGIDMAGVVEEVGANVTRFRRGDEVYGMIGGVGGLQGALAQFAAVDADLLALKSRNLSMREAAALPLAFITAYSGIVDRVGVGMGQTVLVQGGAGGVGHAAVQLAKALGARVFATVSERNRALMEELDVTPIDYAAQNVEQYVAAHTQGKGFDVVVDTVGGATLDASFAAVRHFGHVVSALGWGTHALAPLSFREATYSGVFTLYPLLSGERRRHHGEMLEEATRLADAGKLKPRLDTRNIDQHQLESAFETLESGRTNGKLVVTIR